MRDRAPLPADPVALPAPGRRRRSRASTPAARRSASGTCPLGARDAILGHLRLLLAWTAAVNLTAIRDPEAAVTGHLLDSLAAVPLLRAAGVRRFLDLGSGGGYPGLPLALALPAETRPARRLDRQEGRLPARRGGRGRGRRPGRGGRGSRRGAGGRPPPPRAMAGGDGARGGAARRARGARLPPPRARRPPAGVEARRPRRRAGPGTRGRGGARRRRRGGADGGVEIVPLPAPIPGLEDHVLVAVRKGRAHGSGTGRARRRSGSAVRGDAPHAPGGAAIRSAAMRVAVLSDIHANLPALDAVLAALGDVDAVWQLGDVVGYGPHPDEVVARLREIGATGVRGNHDAAALGHPGRWSGSTRPPAGRSSGRPGGSRRRPGPGWPACRSEPSSAR